ncbi:hypothetical protein [Candidatus Palauibacter sp.]|uniref:hypothetical protein n=1 Tax=Candidatus Palauibacter sp. TaxID=3101350 RepID=UPI003B5B6891
MDMDLVVVFAFVSTIVLIITGGIVLFPLSRKLAYFLEQAARDRADRLAGGVGEDLPGTAPNDRLLQTLSDLQDQVGQIAERQAFTEQLLERRLENPDREAGRLKE